MAHRAPRVDRTRRLPAELLLRTFDYLECDAWSMMLVPGAVCSRWRALALSHPVFSRHISIGPITSGSMSILLAQLAAGESTGAGFELAFVGPPPTDVLPVLPHLVTHMARCQSIHLFHQGVPSQWRAFLYALCQRPAPRLRKLEILTMHFPFKSDAVDPDEETMGPIQISPAIFCGQASRLRSLSLMGPSIAMIQQGAKISAFAAVESLELRCGFPPYGHSYSLFAAFPSLRRLMIYAGGILPPPVDVGLLAALELDYTLFVALPVSWAAAIAAVGLMRIPELEVGGDKSGPGPIAQMLVIPYTTCLRGPLSLSFRHHHLQQTTIVLRSQGHKRTLTITDVFKWNSSICLKWMSTLAVILPRITRLDVWYHARSLLFNDLSFPAVQTMAIHLDGPLLNTARPTTCAKFPSLRELVVHTCPVAPNAPVRVHANFVADLFEPMLAVTSPPSLIVKPPLQLIGDRTLLLTRVRAITEV